MFEFAARFHTTQELDHWKKYFEKKGYNTEIRQDEDNMFSLWIEANEECEEISEKVQYSIFHPQL